ncbi:DUF6879 family protein [Actinomadura sp. BRA 177]|uniref:DUF6879 family protein n=1 Tax=Actinomadura sp. BRA 177 TaxID=2745202 RepID=UPI0034D982D0
MQVKIILPSLDLHRQDQLRSCVNQLVLQESSPPQQIWLAPTGLSGPSQLTFPNLFTNRQIRNGHPVPDTWQARAVLISTYRSLSTSLDHDGLSCDLTRIVTDADCPPRVRVVSKPLTDYIRWGHSVTLHNGRAVGARLMWGAGGECAVNITS